MLPSSIRTSYDLKSLGLLVFLFGAFFKALCFRRRTMTMMVEARKRMFLETGFIPGEGRVIEVTSRDVSDLDLPENAPAFYFFDRYEATLVVDGEEVELRSYRQNSSGTHFLGGKVYTLEQIKEHFPDEAALIWNIGQSRSKKAILTSVGLWREFEDSDDVVIDV